MHSIDTKLLLNKKKLKKYLKKSRKRMKAMRQALRFYADWENWVEIPPEGGVHSYAEWDRGTIARQVLKLPPPGNEMYVAPHHYRDHHFNIAPRTAKAHNGLNLMSKAHKELLDRLDERANSN